MLSLASRVPSLKGEQCKWESFVKGKQWPEIGLIKGKFQESGALFATILHFCFQLYHCKRDGRCFEERAHAANDLSILIEADPKIDQWALGFLKVQPRVPLPIVIVMEKW